MISHDISPQMLISRQAFSCSISYNVTTFDIPALWKTKAISIFNERFFTTCFKKITQKRRKSFYLLSSNVSISKISDAIKNFFSSPLVLIVLRIFFNDSKNNDSFLRREWEAFILNGTHCHNVKKGISRLYSHRRKFRSKSRKIILMTLQKNHLILVM